MRKFTIKIIALLLNNNTMAKFGTEVNLSQLVVKIGESADQAAARLLAEGFITEITEPAADEAATEPSADELKAAADAAAAELAATNAAKAKADAKTASDAATAAAAAEAAAIKAQEEADAKAAADAANTTGPDPAVILNKGK